MCSRRNFFAAFRVVAWQWLYYQRDRAEIYEGNPDFADCPLYCDDKTLRPVAACHECPVAQATSTFKAQCRELLQERVFHRRPAAWSLETLLRTVEQVVDLDAEVERGRVNRMWTLVTARLVSIFRHERYKLRLIDDFNRKQQQGNT